MAVRFSEHEFDQLKGSLVLYNCALKNIETRVNILLDDFMHLQSYNPIEHVTSRLKSPESIAAKLHRRGFPVTAQSAVDNLFDIAGIRCICSYSKDIAFMVDIFRRQGDMKILYERDYITHPKSTGYRSHHLALEIPIYLAEETKFIPVEVQIRTQAMDFWASLEHKARYKYDDTGVPEYISQELVACAEEIAALDTRMYKIQQIMEGQRCLETEENAQQTKRG